ncbi:FecR domain-containing protein [Niastella sp. OAS944]|uniref:FecR domain-containing protein n=1 Tax=Niastella sp. OAS944 TaxID=2664089 RepID=UPI00348E32A3|nr:ferric-dicitrate binding protein FerR (iron transport regulator) [Chitinophagaceae bacterium OAS944]
MPEMNDHYNQLLTAYLNNTCTPQQVEELMQWLQQDASNRVMLQSLQAEFNKAMEASVEAPAETSNRLRANLLLSIQPPVNRIYKRIYFRIAEAAAVLLLMGAGWFFLYKRGAEKNVARQTEPSAQTSTTNSTGAYITLASGERIELGKTGNDAIINDSSNIIKLGDGQIAYDSSLANNTEITYHTLTVPRGVRMVRVMLADGTMVWLNTASSLKYPTAFSGNERKVELTGEAYFEVTHDAARSFLVSTKNITVNVLGTGFNVSAYDDDEHSNVVLVKGSVALTANGNTGVLTKQLTPGNMASFSAGTDNIAVSAVKTDEFVSWKDGYLIFRQAPLEKIVKRISRYYDAYIDTKNLAHSDETFSGRLDLQNSIDDVMNLICLGTPYIYSPIDRKLILKK